MSFSNNNNEATYDGEVIDVRVASHGKPPRPDPRDGAEVVVRVLGENVPRTGDNVRLITMRPDEAIGREFRELLRGLNVDEIRELTDAVDTVGWPSLVDLIREVAR